MLNEEGNDIFPRTLAADGKCFPLRYSTTMDLSKVRAALPRLLSRLNDYGPGTRLGRWCGPWYNSDCQPMLKGGHADVDNSACLRTTSPDNDFRRNVTHVR